MHSLALRARIKVGATRATGYRAASFIDDEDSMQSSGAIMTAGWIRSARLVPGPGDLVFAIVLGLVLVGGRHGLFNDPGTPWHLRLGREIRATGAVPREDTLTFTHTGEPWVDQSWGFDLLLATVVDRWGWSAAIALTALGLAGLYAALARGLVADGSSPLVAVAVAIQAAAIGSIHFLIRPHLFTFLFFYLTLRACQKQHDRGGWGVFRVPVSTAILANLHGGFVALPVIVATAGLGHAISGRWDASRRRELLKFATAFAISCLAGLANPYGIGLYGHVGHLLISSGVTGLIAEYQPAPFGKPGAEALEWVLLAMVGLPVVSSRRIDRYLLAHVIVWLHLALTSIRNAPLFAMAAAPALASLLDGLPMSVRRSWKRDGRPSIWPALAACGLLIAVACRIDLGGFDPRRWPITAVATLDRQPTSARIFHEQDWGGLIEAECRPTRRSYLDDRFEIFGKEAILEYLDILNGGPAWDAVRDRDRIDMVWLRPDRGLARRLLKEPGWSVLHRDEVSILFARPAGETPSVNEGKMAHL
jgi:hypothetical protein